MAVELLKEKWANRINTVTIGATKEEGGTRSASIKVGGESTLPFLFEEGEMPNPPVVAMEVLDMAPEDWPEVLAKELSSVWSDPAKWAKKCVDDYKARLICLRFQSAHPAAKDSSADRVPEVVKSVLNAVGVPLIAPVPLFKLSPAGSAPSVIDQASGSLPPVDVSVWL